ncbi:dethiobiotin synthase [Inmirania thermothiophila]|uniref:ATP-dependent dethiobiotin synthetase BioD n=1 Tax=Inmirania thermothiophila TaxID=1750597 RepID=A0A3N1Y6Q0_9GAMM|nr:dethiobiotin synthase [Inmirania thermothiophila]ROR34506.1 dethiobiotin synthetase [Inmirania thermothiophila]
MTAGWFVTGTDTGAGKTVAAAALIHRLRAEGLRVAPMKPVASGCRATPGGLRSEDAEILIEAAGGGWDYADVNPYALAPPVAPHIAAAEAGVEIRRAPILEAYARLRAGADAVVVEGVGGWLVPLGAHWTTADLAVAMGLPVLLVVGLRLGCISHALLTAEAVAARGLRLAGWIAARVEPATERAGAVVEALQARLAAPLLGVLPHARPPRPERLAASLALPR